MLTLKIMSGQDLADSNPCKSYMLIPLAIGTSIAFSHENRRPKVETVDTEGNTETMYPDGNCYVLEGGKTIATFAHMAPPPETGEKRYPMPTAAE